MPLTFDGNRVMPEICTEYRRVCARFITCLPRSSAAIWAMGLAGGLVVCTATHAADESAPVPAGLQVVEQDQGWKVLENGKPILFYQTAPKASPRETHRRADYVHPLWSLDGDVLTEDFPADHLHHRGVFWAWHQIVVGNQHAGDGWSTQDFLSRVNDVTVRREPDRVVLIADVDWTSSEIRSAEGRDAPFVKQQTRITVHPQREDMRFVDFTIVLRPLRPHVHIGGADNFKGYSGFSVRLKAPKSVQIEDAAGVLEEDGIQRSGGRWIDVRGTYPSTTGRSGVAIFTHPQAPSTGQLWHSRHQGLQNAIYPGRTPVPLPQDHPLVLHYRLVLHRGPLTTAQLEQLAQRFAKEPVKP